ncbi:MAG: hypothetical protein HUJ53_05590 [Holdemanella sp.]|nr:hypothetical protein [Holdemanella sp.]
MKDTRIIKELKEKFPQTDFWLDSMIEEDVKYAVRNGFLGITTSPTITPKAIEAEGDVWKEMMRKYIEMHPDYNENEILWECMYEASSQRAKLLLPIYDEDGFNGRFCIQANVFDYMNGRKIEKQAERIHACGTNFMAKIPTTKGGIYAMEEVIASGHSVMATATSTVAQVKQACLAMYRGLQRRKEQGLSTKGIAMAVAMQLGLPEECYRVYTTENHVSINPEALDYSSIAVAKKAYKMIQKEFPDVLFVLSNFTTELHWTEFMGGRIMLTIAPKLISDMEAKDVILNRIDEEVPMEYINQLLDKIPFYKYAYEEDLLEMENFQYYEGFCRTMNHFMIKYEGALHTVRKELAPDPYNRQTYKSSY